MRNCNKTRHILNAIIVVVVVAIMTFAGCTKVDDTLGFELTPDNQEMKIGMKKFDPTYGKSFFETRLFRTDSIMTSGLSYGYFGSMRNDTFGLRTACLLSQYVPLTTVDTNGFGFRPIFDSAQLIFSIKSYAGDTTLKQEFEVYEVVDNSFIKNSKDSVFFASFDPAPYVSKTPLFTFTFPDQDNGIYTTSTALTMQPTTAGRQFVRRLMLLEGDYKDDNSVYESDTTWVKYFKGLYIKTKNDVQAPRGAMYSSELASTGFVIYGRNRNETDPTLIQDTVSAGYYFYYSQSKAGNVSLSTIKHDYSASNIKDNEVKKERLDTKNYPTNGICFVEGMSGVVTEITFTEDFFNDISQILLDENNKNAVEGNGKVFSTLAFNQAKLRIYFRQSDYDYQNIVIGDLFPWMDYAPTRLGLYTDYSNYYKTQATSTSDASKYSSLTPIADYNYSYENSYSTTLPYGGKINRSLGCYEFDISSYLQSLWNRYLDVKAKTSGNAKVDLSQVKNRTIYLAPEASSLQGFSYVTLQGLNDRVNNAPIKLDLTYTMIK